MRFIINMHYGLYHLILIWYNFKTIMFFLGDSAIGKWAVGFL